MPPGACQAFAPILAQKAGTGDCEPSPGGARKIPIGPRQADPPDRPGRAERRADEGVVAIKAPPMPGARGR